MKKQKRNKNSNRRFLDSTRHENFTLCVLLQSYFILWVEIYFDTDGEKINFASVTYSKF